MSARIRNITFDCRDAHALARFWAEVLGFIDDPSDPNLPDDLEIAIIDPTGHHPGLLFIAVPEAKATKNRLHLDLQSAEGREAAVERLLALGGTVIDDRRQPDGTGWVVMADPEGNELCVERSKAERDDFPTPVDTGERPMPPIHAADERTMLVEMLDWYRAGVVQKVAGVSAHHAAAQPLRSSTSIAGLVKHLALVEDSWFTDRFAGEPEPTTWVDVDWDADPDWEFTLRWVLVHLIEETARHLGHLDVLREHLDGTTGE